MIKPYYEDYQTMIYCGHVLDVLKQIDPESVQCVVTSPPYWGLRDYGLEPYVWGGDAGCKHEFPNNKIKHLRTKPGVNAQCGNTLREVAGRTKNEGAFCLKCGAYRGSLGLEPTPELYVQHLVEIFREVRRVLRKDGTLWLNLGDSYAGSAQEWCKESGQRIGGPKQKTNAGSIWPGGRPPGYISSRQENGLKPKDLCMIPFRVAMALQVDGWWLRSDIVWSKPNPMPESVRDRPTRSHEYMFLLTKSQQYFYDIEAIMEPCESGPSDIRKMTEKRDLIGGKHKTLVDPYSKASSATQMGLKRAVGGTRIHGNIPGRDDAGAPCNKPDQLYRNARTVWTIATQPYRGAHFATFPEKLVEPCVLAGSRMGDTILDIFSGSGVVGIIAKKFWRRAILIDAKEEYCKMAIQRLPKQEVLFGLRDEKG